MTSWAWGKEKCYTEQDEMNRGVVPNGDIHLCKQLLDNQYTHSRYFFLAMLKSSGIIFQNLSLFSPADLRLFERSTDNHQTPTDLVILR